MQCHKNSKQINLLLDALKHPKVDIFVHVDANSEHVREDVKKRDGIYLLKDSVDVDWDRFGQVAALNLLKAAVSRREYSHYFLISGQDYPMKSMEEIVRLLEAHEDNNFIECYSVKTFEKRNDIFFPRTVIGRKMW